MRRTPAGAAERGERPPGLEVIGAGFGRTGTQSLGLAFERLLEAPCYGLRDLLENPRHLPVWKRALDGHGAEWDSVFDGYRSTVDLTAALFFSELADAYPGALVVLSVRDPDEWWPSINRTVFEALRNPRDDPLAKALEPTRQFTLRMLETRFTPRWHEEGRAKDALVRHDAAVRAAIPSGRLVEWRVGDGWTPICEGLGLPVPQEPFPHINTRAEFRARFELGAG